MIEDKDPPIEPQDWRGGVKVVDIGDLRIARGLSRRPRSACEHRRLVYDKSERRIWCHDCESNVDAFDAFLLLVERYSAATDNLNRRQKALTEAEAFQLRTIAAKKMDEAWRSRNMVPACPHCNHGLFPEHFKNGMSMLGKEYAEARLKTKPQRS